MVFRIRFRQRQIRVELTHDEERYEMVEGEPLEARIRGEAYVLTGDGPLVLPAP
jgi:hypothetical protein